MGTKGVGRSGSEAPTKHSLRVKFVKYHVFLLILEEDKLDLG